VSAQQAILNFYLIIHHNFNIPDYRLSDDHDQKVVKTTKRPKNFSSIVFDDNHLREDTPFFDKKTRKNCKKNFRFCITKY